jgi:hypothetical protein
MRRYFESLRPADVSAIHSVPDGIFLVRVDRVQYRWHKQKPYYEIRFAVLKPKHLTGCFMTRRPRHRPDCVLGDRGYDSEQVRRGLLARHIEPFLAKRNTEHGSGLGRWRWMVERTFAWLFNSGVKCSTNQFWFPAFPKSTATTSREPTVADFFVRPSKLTAAAVAAAVAATGEHCGTSCSYNAVRRSYGKIAKTVLNRHVR